MTQTLPASFADRRRGLAETVISQLLSDAGDSSRMSIRTPFFSVYYGAAGIAYALSRFAAVGQDASILAAADLWATYAVRRLKDPTALKKPAPGTAVGHADRISIYHSPTGVHLVRALISESTDRSEGVGKAADAFIRAGQRQSTCQDLTLGRSGLLLGCAIFLERASTLDRVRRENLLRLGQELQNTILPMSDPDHLGFNGVAHGRAGVAYAVMRWAHATGSDVDKAVRVELTRIADVAVSANDEAGWPKSATDTAVWPGWCHGSAGYVHVWALAADLIHADYMRLAEAAGRFTAAHVSQGASLCCGTAGQAYALLELHRVTGDPMWLADAHRLTERAMERQGGAVHGAGLYPGLLGVAVLAAEIEAPMRAQMPLFGR
jgi:lantibiotic modifying enzyme